MEEANSLQRKLLIILKELIYCMYTVIGSVFL